MWVFNSTKLNKEILRIKSIMINEDKGENL